MSESRHQTIYPPILYFGTPVVLIGSTNPDGSPNVAPISSAWWLGWNCVLGFGSHSQTPQNILRTGHCTINLPSESQVAYVDRLARLTASNPVPPRKQTMGYTHCSNKFSASGLTHLPAQVVTAPLVRECPIQMEAELSAPHPLTPEAGNLIALELRVLRVHAHPEILRRSDRNRIDPDLWRPLIMSFCNFYGLSGQVHPSRLSEIPEDLYRPQRIREELESFSHREHEKAPA
jgi:flavin reductase (DIM6/NTAB) family NADH-FMN oxidoreductase RutF